MIIILFIIIGLQIIWLVSLLSQIADATPTIEKANEALENWRVRYNMLYEETERLRKSDAFYSGECGKHFKTAQDSAARLAELAALVGTARALSVELAHLADNIVRHTEPVRGTPPTQ